MATGKQHAQAANRVIVAGAILSFTMLPLPVAPLAVSGLVIGKYANPDVRDQAEVRNHAEHLISRKLGCLWGWLWTLYWWPLARLIPHRHWASHLPGVATIIAWLYLFLPAVVAVWHFAPDYLSLTLILVCWTLPGWFVQDCIHLWQDKFGIRW